MLKICFLLLAAFLAVAAPSRLLASAPAHGGAAKEAEAPKEEDLGGLIKLPGNPSSQFYVNLDPLVLPVIGSKGVTEIVSLIVKLQVEDQRTVERVNSISPKLNDAYVRALYGNIDRSIYRNGRFLDINKLKEKLIKVTDALIGKGIVKDVLIEGVNQRQYN